MSCELAPNPTLRLVKYIIINAMTYYAESLGTDLK